MIYGALLHAEVGKKKNRRTNLKHTIGVPSDSFLLNIEFLSWVSCLTHYTSSDWSGKEGLSLSCDSDVSFQGQDVGGRGDGSPVSSHLPLMDPHPDSPGDTAHSCWWVKPGRATEKPPSISVGPVRRWVGQRSHCSDTNQYLRPMPDVQSFPQLPKVRRTEKKGGEKSR